ncbi:hypothetical protein JNW90_12010 [Micromonospora sp. STR1s_5]|nr:hypothetical protein [Micromonospora sp. STR1s_5]
MLTVPPGAFIEGDGGSTNIRQTDLTKGALVWDAANAQGGIRDINISAAAPLYNSPGSIGTALNLRNVTENFMVSNVKIMNFDTGITLQNAYSGLFQNVTIGYFRDIAVSILDSTIGKHPSNDNRFHHFKVQNIQMVSGGTPVVPNPVIGVVSLTGGHQIGLLEQAGGGNFFGDWDVINVGYGLYNQPIAGKTVAYSSYTDFLADTSYYDNITLDGAYGNLASLHFTNGWASYSTSGSGLVTKGANLSGVQFVGGRLRQNGKHGWDHQGGREIELIGTQVASNSKLASLTYHGVRVAAGVSGWKITGGRIGNLNQGELWAQADSVHIDAGSSNRFSIVGVDLSGPGAFLINNNATGRDQIISGNLPKTSGVNQTAVAPFTGSTRNVVPAGTILFLGSNGEQADAYRTSYLVSRAAAVTRVYVASSAPPGTGQNYAYTLLKNGSPTALGGNIVGAATEANFHGLVVVGPNDSLAIQVITSPGSSPEFHRWLIEPSD